MTTTHPSNVFNRPLHLSGILDNAADQLYKSWFDYEWNDRTRCNCGVVARQILQTNANKLKKLLPPIYHNGVFCPSWQEMTEVYCTETGLTENQVFSSLLQAGLRREDFVHLEQLSHVDILAKMGEYRSVSAPVSRSRKSDVIAYLRTWAVGIEKYHDPVSAQSKSETLAV